MQPSLFAAFIVLAAGLMASGTHAQQLPELPEAREGACGQPLALTYQLAEPLDIAGLAPIAAEFSRSEPLYLEFTLSGRSQVAVRTEASVFGIDPVIVIYDVESSTVIRDDDTGGPYDALTDLTLDPGTYCAQVRLIGSSGAEADLAVTILAGTGADAQTIADRSPLQGLLGPSNRCGAPLRGASLGDPLTPGFASIEVSANVGDGQGQSWSFSVTEDIALKADTSDADFDTVLVLYDDAGVLVTHNDDGDNNSPGSELQATLEPGDYCLTLTGFNGAGGQTGLIISDAGPAATAADFGPCENPQTPALGASLVGDFESIDASAALSQAEVYYWTFETAEEMTVQFDARSSDIDTLLTLFDPSGAELESNDDGPGMGTDSRIVRALQPGRYCVALESLDGRAGLADISANYLPEESQLDLADIPPCSVTGLTSLLSEDIGPGFGRLEAIDGLMEVGRADYAFTVAENIRLRAEAGSDAVDTVLKLTDADGEIISENDDAPGRGTNSLIEAELSPGIYCMSLESYSGETGTALLSVTEVDEAMLQRERVDRGEAMPTSDMNVAIDDLGVLDGTLTSTKSVRDQAKWISFSLEEAANVRIDAISPTANFNLALYSESGDQVGFTSGESGMLPSNLTATLPVGRYLVAVAFLRSDSAGLRSVTVTKTGG